MAPSTPRNFDLVRTLFIGLLVSVSGCYDANIVTDGGAPGDAPDSLGVDVSDAGPTLLCELPGGYRRCLAGCPACSNCGAVVPTFCGDWVSGGLCHFARDGTSPEFGRGCDLGLTCWFDGTDVPADEAEGICVPPEVCLASGPEVPPHRCFWPDSTEVTRVPEHEACPDYDSFSAASCGLEPCPFEFSAIACAGLSDVRSFGIVSEGGICRPGVSEDLAACRAVTMLGQDCACMHPVVPAPTTTEVFGYAVSLGACLEYRRHFGGVACAEAP